MIISKKIVGVVLIVLSFWSFLIINYNSFSPQYGCEFLGQEAAERSEIAQRNSTIYFYNFNLISVILLAIGLYFIFAKSRTN